MRNVYGSIKKLHMNNQKKPGKGQKCIAPQRRITNIDGKHGITSDQ